MTGLPTYEVFVGESLPDLGLFVRENGQLVPGLGSGHTFELKIAPLDGAVAVTKTSGIVGQTGTGFAPLGTPNVMISWAAGVLGSLTEGSFLAQLKITRTADNKVRILQWLIRTRAAL